MFQSFLNGIDIDGIRIHSRLNKDLHSKKSKPMCGTCKGKVVLSGDSEWGKESATWAAKLIKPTQAELAKLCPACEFSKASFVDLLKVFFHPAKVPSFSLESCSAYCE